MAILRIEFTRKFLPLAFSTALIGCSHPSIDAASEASLAASMEKMAEPLSAADRERFKAALAYAVYRVVGEQDRPLTSEQVLPVMKTMEGKSAAQIIGDAKTTIAKEISEAEVAAKTYKDASAILSKIEISGAKYERDITTSRIRTELHATLLNGTDKPIGSIEFDYKLRTAGRSIPWTSGSGTFFVSGGLEPNESREDRASGRGIDSDFIVLTSQWQQHPDAVLEITVSDARVASGASIMGSGVSKSSVDRLDRLRKISESLN